VKTEGLRELQLRVLELLVCPKCRGELFRVDAGLACQTCELVYPILNGVPLMLTARAKKLR